jgi:nucleoside-diphosphate-sugar epimerase
MTRLMVTGATGFIGRSLCRKLSNLGYQISGISKSGGTTNNILIDSVDCIDQEVVNRYCQGKSFNGIIHLAASVPPSFYGEEAKRSLLENVQMTINLLEVFRKQGKGVFIYASSSSVYGYPERLPVLEEKPVQPDGFYPLGKFFGELLCQQYQKEPNLLIAILRISAPYGPGMRKETVIRKFIKKALLSEDLTLYGTGSRSQDFTYIEDITNAIVKAYQTRVTGIFNISTGISTSMRDLAVTILHVLPDSKSKIVYVDEKDPQESYRAAFSFEKARKSFGYQPEFPLARGIEEYAKIIKEELKL